MFRGSSPLLSPSCSALAVAIAIALSASVRASKMQHALKHIGKGDSDELREIKGELEHEKFAEEIPNNVIEKHRDYEVREYPRSKWICTKDVVDIERDDPFRDWKTKYDADPFKVLASPEFLKVKDVKMFFSLMGYIMGKNEKGAKIGMSKPATTRVKPIDGKKEWHETCVWAGPAYSSRELPKPKDPKVYFNVMKRIVVYVRKFGGWAFSHGEWEHQLHLLRRSLRRHLGAGGRPEGDLGSLGSSEEEEDEVALELSRRRHQSLESGSMEAGLRAGRPERSNYFGACYQSPFKRRDRRNEVWIVREEE